ncbi:MAG TPA: hypothetical protein VF508_00430 [Pyrinomonadaceae bacterium]
MDGGGDAAQAQGACAGSEIDGDGSADGEATGGDMERAAAASGEVVESALESGAVIGSAVADRAIVPQIDLRFCFLPLCTLYTLCRLCRSRYRRRD